MAWSPDPQTRSSNVTKLFDVFKEFKFSNIFKKDKKDLYNNFVIVINSSMMPKILLFEAILLTYKEYFGEEITCSVEEPPRFTRHRFVDYCWLEGSFTIPAESPDQSPYSGVSSMYAENGSKFYHRYYPWVYLSVIIQSIMFYCVKWIWKSTHDNRFFGLLTKLDKDKKNLNQYSENERITLVQSVADLLFSNNPFYNNIIFMELLCLIHLLLQIWITDRFLSGNFHYLGILWLESSYKVKSITSLFLSTSSSESSSHSLDSFNANDPLLHIFPRMVKCTLKFYGPSGDPSTYDGLCFLAANSLNEKVYLSQWFFYHFTLLFIIIVLTWRTLILLVPPLRSFALSFTSSSHIAQNYWCLLESPGNWFLLHILSSLLPVSHFKDLMDAVVESHYDKYGNPLFNSRYQLLTKKKGSNEAENNEGSNNSDHKDQKETKDFEIIWPDDCTF
ncbi:innexin shaking-B-like [Tetranychus urticae]|uniref:Innexin n=1 Tax=Tetranychus urticae TaxID=32264 RepID=T1KEY2_TETUR|nr:innexin shaking-B-like [Tetranychus urticae]